MNVTEIAKTLAEATALELKELRDELKETYGFEPVGTVTAVVQDTTTNEKSEFTVTLSDTGAQKVAVIKAVKEITGLGLGEAKALVDNAPSPILEKADKSQAEAAEKLLKEAGATVEVV